MDAVTSPIGSGSPSLNLTLNLHLRVSPSGIIHMAASIPSPSPADGRRPTQLRLLRPEDVAAESDSPADSPAGHRTINPASPSLFPPEPLDRYFDQVASEHADTLLPVPEEQRAVVAGTLNLTAFYEAHMAAWRQQQVESGGCAKGTQDKELQSLRRYTEWDLGQAPAGFPGSLTWPGLPIGRITQAYLQQFIHDLKANPNLRQGTVDSTWNHLRTILNRAVKLKVLDRAPDAPVLRDPRETSDGGDLDGDFCKTSFTLDQLGRLFVETSRTPDLQSAMVVSANCGPRSGDLFRLRWGVNVRIDQETPEIRYRAQKTGKRHVMPLAPVTVAALQRLRKGRLFEPQGLVFPRLTSAANQDPEGSKAARRRNKAIKDAMRRTGIDPARSLDYNKPWQVGRTTCNTRLNSHKGGIGQFLLHGPDHDPNSKSYYNYIGDARAAVMSVEQPPEFLTLLD